ncbi:MULTISPECIES: prephenate dehydratase [Enterococcus]|nr:prephenate dehydratase [Enterococcus sulfureus]
MMIGYLGPKSSFTYQATTSLFPNDAIQAFHSIPLCLESLANGEIESAIVPIENSLEGSVHTSMDYLFKSQGLTVTKEIILPIKQQLMGTATTPAMILSHPQALAQSQHFLTTHYPHVTLKETPSTTYAAEYVATHPNEALLAIASKEAAEAFALPIIAKDIQDNDQNQTRFWLIQKESITLKNTEPAQKLTLFVTLPQNQAGALHQILAVFAWRNIDLTKIESRPLKTSLGQYYFVIDIVVEQKEWVHYALEEIKLLGATIKPFGPYSILKATETL